jgi:predicted permease
MKALRRVWRRLIGTLTGGSREADLADELESHVQMMVDDNLRRGMTPSEARRAALVTFGGIEPSKELYRDQSGFAWIENLRQDVRYAFRGIRKSPGFTAVAVACLALGIGANTAIFTIVNAVMIHMLPVRQPEQLVLLSYQSKSYPRGLRKTGSGYGRTSLPHVAFESMQKGTQSLSGLFAFVPVGFNNRSLTVRVKGQPDVAAGEMVGGTYFSVLGVSPVLGRPITEEDLKPDAPYVAVVSHAYWSRELGGDPGSLGRRISINGAPFTLVGVAPPGFFGVDPQLAPDIWLPLRDMPEVKPWGNATHGMFADRWWWWCMMMGRLKPGVTEAQARAELDVLFQGAITQGVDHLPRAEEIPHIELTPASRGLEMLQRNFSKPLRILLIAVALELLIACANVATLLLARANSRRREMSVRLAIGASCARLMRQFLTESVLLALGGGLAGLLLARWGSRSLLLLMSGPGQSLGLDIRPDATVLGFTACVSLLTGILFGLVPAFRATRIGLSGQLKESAGSTAPRTALAKTLVGLQVALSVCLLFGAALFVRTLQNLESQDFGFNRQQIVLFELDPLRSGYKPERVTRIYDEALQTIQALPGVRSVTTSAMALLSGWTNNSSTWTDGPAPADPLRSSVSWNVVGPDFAATMGIPILLGREIGWHEMNGRRVAMVNESMVQYFFPGQNPIGHHFSFGGTYNPATAFEIVGVVKNAKYDRVRDEPPRTAYIPYSANPDGNGRMSFEVRTAGDPLAMTGAIREAIRRIDPNLPLIGIKTQQQQIDESLAQERMFANLSSFFGLLALVLVAVGLYGTLAYAVLQRTSEIGIRMALGAGRAQVLWMVLRESLLVVLCGLAVGLPAALALTRFIASMLYGVKPYDAPAIVATIIILAIAGSAAGMLPANRASRVDPIRALRYE